MTLGEEEKITCCKNTVNSTAECAEDKREKNLLATSWSSYIETSGKSRPTAPLTFSDLLC